MKIKPTAGKVQIKIDEVKVGSLNMEGSHVAKENGTIVAVGEGVVGYKKGDKILFKSWAVDIIPFEGETYYFIDVATKGLCGFYGV